jgi:UDP-N-acetylglucosamine--N-acetylmuramyl-(pentapeptide) pyrophosphoryl-undecaprenol N-acetylglucosamine transferase
MSAKTILIMAGGTGGHIMPALAVAEVLRERGWRVLWLGNPEKMEGKLVPAHGIGLIPLHFQGVRGKSLKALLSLPFLLLKAFAQAWGALSAVKPDVVLGMGGYVAFPGSVIAALRGTPVVLHEQNAVAGSTNRYLAKVARRVLSGFPGVLLRAENVGNPVRAEMGAMPRPEQRYPAHENVLRILVVGGSLGAQALNTVLPQVLALLAPHERPQVTHQAGAQHIESLRQAYEMAGVQADCCSFINDMAGAIANADLLICRAGAMTVSEVAAAGVAALFVPFPHAIDDHQTANARFLSDAKAAWLQPQNELSPEWLAQWLRQRTREELQAVAVKARQQARPHAAIDIADVCEQLTKNPS